MPSSANSRVWRIRNDAVRERIGRYGGIIFGSNDIPYVVQWRHCQAKNPACVLISLHVFRALPLKGHALPGHHSHLFDRIILVKTPDKIGFSYLYLNFSLCIGKDIYGDGKRYRYRGS